MGPDLETAWSELLAELPEEAPSPALVHRVMLRVAEARGAARDLEPRWRLALVAGLALVGLSALALPIVLILLPIPIGGLIAALADTVKAGALWLAQGASFWRFLADVGRTTSVVLATPEATAFLASIALVSAAALRLLIELTRSERRNVDAAIR